MAAPTKIVVYVNPIGGMTKYEVQFEGKTLRRPLVIGPTAAEEIADRLRAEGLVYHSKLIDDVLNAIIQGAVKRGKAEVREEIEAPGFYLVGGKLRPVKVELRAVTRDELKDALLLLNELAEWYKHAIDRFSTIVKWDLIAPFSYALKQKGKWIQWIYIYGASYTGKTTLGEMVLSIWGLGSSHVKGGANVDTVARLGHVLSQSTFPVLVNEPGNALMREEIVEVLKSAIENQVVRGKYIRGAYTEIPSLAPMIFTSNRVLPRDDALLRRLIVLTFTYGDRISRDRAQAFSTQVKPKLGGLKALGHFVADKVVNERVSLDGDWNTLAEELLRMAYEYAGLEPPQWVGMRHQADEDVYEDVREAIRSFLVKRINEEYNRFVGRVTAELPTGVEVYDKTQLEFDERVRVVLSNNLNSVGDAQRRSDHNHHVDTSGAEGHCSRARELEGPGGATRLGVQAKTRDEGRQQTSGASVHRDQHGGLPRLSQAPSRIGLYYYNFIIYMLGLLVFAFGFAVKSLGCVSSNPNILTHQIPGSLDVLGLLGSSPQIYVETVSTQICVELGGTHSARVGDPSTTSAIPLARLAQAPSWRFFHTDLWRKIIPS